MQELTSIEHVKAWASDAGRTPATFLLLDLAGLDAELTNVDLRGCVFVSCGMSPRLIEQVARQQGVVLGRRGDLPFEAPPGKVYRVADIYRDFDPAKPKSWFDCFDYKAYKWFMDPDKQLPRPIGIADSIAARVHDVWMEREAWAFLGDTPTIGFMGGHDRLRDDKAYPEVAKLARVLRRKKKMIVTGGGPGFMEAANLGAFLAPYPDDALDMALEILVRAPKFSEIDKWLATACEVRAKFLNGDWRAPELPESWNLGIPTWLYGHEPPNLFSTHISKFFYNSLREDGLVTVANGGIIFAEGNAGTVQEVFQDATQNYYRKPESAAPTPMVLFNSTPGFWNLPSDAVVDKQRKKPLLPLLKQLAGERAATVFDKAVLLSDDINAIATFLLEYEPKAPTKGTYRRLSMMAGQRGERQ